MKAILSMALVLGVCGLAGAADDKVVDPVGTWKCEYEIGGQQRTSTLKIKKDGDNLAGTMSWPDQDETKLKDLKLKDGTLTFSAERLRPAWHWTRTGPCDAASLRRSSTANRRTRRSLPGPSISL